MNGQNGPSGKGDIRVRQPAGSLWIGACEWSPSSNTDCIRFNPNTYLRGWYSCLCVHAMYVLHRRCTRITRTTACVAYQLDGYYHRFTCIPLLACNDLRSLSAQLRAFILHPGLHPGPAGNGLKKERWYCIGLADGFLGPTRPHATPRFMAREHEMRAEGGGRTHDVLHEITDRPKTLNQETALAQCRDLRQRVRNGRHCLHPVLIRQAASCLVCERGRH